MDNPNVNNEFEDIRPYTDEEAVAGLARIASHPMVYAVSKYLFPRKPINTLSKMLRQIRGVDDFQKTIMYTAVEWVLQNTVTDFTSDGVENLHGIEKNFLAMSNHRDIVLDPAFTLYTLFRAGLPLTQVAVGDNLLANDTVEVLLRSNGMIKVVRGISARELYLSSLTLSRYIRQTVTSGPGSVWIAQRQGRTKNGLDTTEQGLLKMFDMSGEGSFVENFSALHIVPMSISYEYEPCDFRKAREVLISRTQKYVKKPDEDMHSILTGIRQQKGRVHLHIGTPLSEAEIEAAANCGGNDRYQFIRRAVDRRVIEGYRLFKTNYMGYDLMNGTSKYTDYYTPEDLEAFKAYTEHKLGKLEKRLDKDACRDIFWHIYGNPVVSKESL